MRTPSAQAYGPAAAMVNKVGVNYMGVFYIRYIPDFLSFGDKVRFDQRAVAGVKHPASR